MGCRNGSFSDEGNNAVSSSIKDAFLFTTICLIGQPVDIHAIDGSVYSGIFYTASLEKNFAIVLKKARITKKGNQITNVANETLIETLIVKSEDLVQVIAKGDSCPAEGIFGNFSAFSGKIKFPDSEAKSIKSVTRPVDKSPHKEIPTKESNLNILAKESKLNPGAKMFSPTNQQQRSLVGPTVPIPDPTLMAPPVMVTRPEYVISQFSTPVKIHPYNNIVTDSQYTYPVLGHTGNRTQPVRYTNQYYNQAGPPFINPNPHNSPQIMVGRMGQLIYVHPFGHDVHGSSGLTQLPHQVHLPKYQGNTTGQTLQICLSPPQPPYPVVHPNTNAGPTFSNTKLA